MAKHAKAVPVARQGGLLYLYLPQSRTHLTPL